MRTAVDTNVISALWSREPLATRMADLLAQAQAVGGLVITGAVYAELLAHPKANQAFVRHFLTETRIRIDFVLDENVWTKAGEAFSAYAVRRRTAGAGEPRRLLVDFVIGAHAELQAERLLTLDAGRYSRDFPNLPLMEKGMNDPVPSRVHYHYQDPAALQTSGGEPAVTVPTDAKPSPKPKSDAGHLPER